jgi:hypothetical protein
MAHFMSYLLTILVAKIIIKPKDRIKNYGKKASWEIRRTYPITGDKTSGQQGKNYFSGISCKKKQNDC